MMSAQLLGVLLAFDTVGRVDYMFLETVRIGGRELPSDVATVAEHLGGYYLFWGVLLTLVSFALLVVGVLLL